MKKNLVLWILMASIFAISHSSSAAPFDNTEMMIDVRKATQAKMIELRIGNLQNKKTHISIHDLGSNIGYSDVLKNKTEYSTKVDLSLMPDGQYILLIENETTQYVRAFSISNRDVVLYKNDRDSKQETPSDGTHSNASLTKKAYTTSGSIRGFQKTTPKINYIFVETPDYAYFQFFSISENGIAFENGQTNKKQQDMKSSMRMADALKKPKE